MYIAYPSTHQTKTNIIKITEPANQEHININIYNIIDPKRNIRLCKLL